MQLDPKRLFHLVKGERYTEQVVSITVIGSYPWGTEETKDVWAEWVPDWGEPQLFERHSYGKEQIIDATLHSAIYEILNENTPQTLSIMTGDGNTNKGGSTFPKVIQSASNKDWKVEMWSWKLSTSNIYYDMHQQWENLHLYYFDDYLSEISIPNPATKIKVQCFFLFRSYFSNLP